MNILITICARGGSKGLPKKNIKMLQGKHLIGYSIELAQEFKASRSQDNVTISLSTDSQEIVDIASLYKLSTEYIRPKKLASDEAGKLDAITDLLEYESRVKQIEYDYLIDLDVTAPLRTVGDLNQSLKMLIDNNEALNIFSVSPPHRNPYFNMIEKKEDGYVKLVKPLSSSILSRQKAPVVYDMNASFYIYKKRFFESDQRSAITAKSLAYEVPHLCFDIDHEIDFIIMDHLMASNKLDFKFGNK